MVGYVLTDYALYYIVLKIEKIRAEHSVKRINNKF